MKLLLSLQNTFDLGFVVIVVCSLVTNGEACGQDSKPAKPTSDSNSQSVEKAIPLPLQARISELKKHIESMVKPDDETVDATNKRVLLLAGDLGSAKCTRAAGDLVLEWTRACNEKYFRPNVVLLGYEQSSTLFRQLRDKKRCAIINYELGLVYRRLSRFSDGFEVLKKAEVVFEELGEKGRLGDVAVARGNLHLLLSDFELALRSYVKAEGVFRELGEEDNLATVYTNRSNILTSLSRYEESLKLLAQVEEIRKKNNDVVGLAGVSVNRGLVLSSLSRYDEALKCYEEAFPVFEALNDVAALAEIETNRSSVFLALDRFDDALDSLVKAEDGFQNIGDKLGLAKVESNRAKIHFESNRLDEALAASIKAERLCSEMGDEFGKGNVFLNRGKIFDSMARFQEALREYTKAERLLVKTGDQAGIAAVAGARGNLYLSIGSCIEALRCFEEAEGIYRSLGEEESAAAHTTNRASAYQMLNQYELSLQTYDKAEKYFLKLGNKSTLATIAVNKGGVYRSMLRWDKALDLYEKAERLFTEAGNDYGLAMLAINQGVACSRTKAPGQALSHFKSAERVFRRMNDKVHLARSILGQVPALNELGRSQDAIETLLRGLQIFEQILAKQVQGIGIDSSRNFRGQYRYVPWSGAQAALALQESDQSKRPQVESSVALSFRALEVFEGRSLLEGLVRGVGDLASDAMSEGQRKELAAIRAARRQALTRRERLTRESAEAVEIQGVDDAIEVLDIREQSILEAIRLSDPLITSVVYPKAIDVPDLLAELDKKTAFIELAIHTRLSWGFVATRKRIQLIRLGDASAIKEDSQKLHANISRGTGMLDQALLRRLSKAMIAPVLQALNQSKEEMPQSLIFSLKGELARIPVEVLLTEEPKSGMKFNDLPFLVKRFDVGYVPSATTFVAMKRQGRLRAGQIRKTGLDFFALGMPLDVIAESEEEGLEVSGVSPQVQDSVLKRGKQSRGILFGSKDEVLSVASLFASKKERKALENLRDRIDDEELSKSALISGLKGSRFKVLLRVGANEVNIKHDPELNWARYIHFAGHGEANLTSPSLSRLILAQSQRLVDATGEDGYLYFRELAKLKLHADMLVLSACSTNDGVLFPNEGIMGLAQGGILAGAKSVLATLWRVEDESAQQLMVDFYKRLNEEKGSRIQALANAKREAIRQGLPLSTWAAYILWDAEVAFTK